MISPQEYLKSAIFKNTNELFDDFDENNIKVDLWNGNISLSDISLKPQKIYLNGGLCLDLVQGHIRSVDAKIPWRNMKPGQGSLQCNVEDVSLVFLLVMESPKDIHEIFAQDIGEKMMHIIDEEIKLLGETFKRETWFSKFWNGSVQSVLRRIHFSLRNMKIVILLPTSIQSTIATSSTVQTNKFHVTIRIPTIDVEPIEAPSSIYKTADKKSVPPQVTFSQQISIHGITIMTQIKSWEDPRIAQIHRYSQMHHPLQQSHITPLQSHTYRMSSSTSAGPPSMPTGSKDGDILLCPSYVTIHTWGYKSMKSQDVVDQYHIGMKGHICNIELSLNQTELDNIIHVTSVIQQFNTYRSYHIKKSKLWLIIRKYLKTQIIYHHVYESKGAYEHTASDDTEDSTINPSMNNNNTKIYNVQFSSLPIKLKWKYVLNAIRMMIRLQKNQIIDQEFHELMNYRISEYYRLIYAYVLMNKLPSDDTVTYRKTLHKETVTRQQESYRSRRLSETDAYTYTLGISQDMSEYITNHLYIPRYLDASTMSLSHAVHEMTIIHHLLSPRELLLSRSKVYLDLIKNNISTHTLKKIVTSFLPTSSTRTPPHTDNNSTNNTNNNVTDIRPSTTSSSSSSSSSSNANKTAAVVADDSSGWAKWFGGNSVLNSFQNVQEEDLLNFFLDSSSIALPKEFSSTTTETAIDILIDINRISLSMLLKDIIPIIPKKGNTNKITTQLHHTTLFSINLYGIQCNYNNSIISMKMGSFRVYNQDSIPVITCGSEPDEWLEDYIVNQVYDWDLALSLSIHLFKSIVKSKLPIGLRYKSYHQDHDHSFESFEVEEDNNSIIFDNIHHTYSQIHTFTTQLIPNVNYLSKQTLVFDELSKRRSQETLLQEATDHIIIELRISSISYRWDVQFMSCLQTIIVNSKYALLRKSTTSHFQFSPETSHQISLDLENEYISSSTSTSTPTNILPSKLSLDMICQGIIIRVPYTQQDYDTHRVSTSSHLLSTPTPQTSFKALNISFGKMTMYSGDFLESWMNKHIAPPNKLTHSPKESLKDPSSLTTPESTVRTTTENSMKQNDNSHLHTSKRHNRNYEFKDFSKKLHEVIETIPNQNPALVPQWFKFMSTQTHVLNRDNPMSTRGSQELYQLHIRLPGDGSDSSDDEDDDEEGVGSDYDEDERQDMYGHTKYNRHSSYESAPGVSAYNKTRGNTFTPSYGISPMSRRQSALSSVLAPRAVWGDIDNSIRIASRKMDSNDLIPFVFSIPKIDLSIVLSHDLLDYHNDSIITKLTVTPWNISGVFAVGYPRHIEGSTATFPSRQQQQQQNNYQETVGSHEPVVQEKTSSNRVKIPNFETNLFMSPLKLAASFEDVNLVGDILKELKLFADAISDVDLPEEFQDDYPGEVQDGYPSYLPSYPTSSSFENGSFHGGDNFDLGSGSPKVSYRDSFASPSKEDIKRHDSNVLGQNHHHETIRNTPSTIHTIKTMKSIHELVSHAMLPCRFRLTASLEEIEIKLLSEKSVLISDELFRIIHSYGVLVLQRKYSIRNMLIYQKLAIHQMTQIGCPEQIAEEFTYQYFSVICSLESTEQIQSVTQLFLDFGMTYLQQIHTTHSIIYAPICTLQLSHILCRMDDHQQSNQLGVSFEEFYVCDQEHLPLIHMKSSYHEGFFHETTDSFHDGILNWYQYKRRYTSTNTIPTTTNIGPRKREKLLNSIYQQPMRPISKIYSPVATFKSTKYQSNIMQEIVTSAYAFHNLSTSFQTKKVFDRACSIFMIMLPNHECTADLSLGDLDVTIISSSQLMMILEVLKNFLDIKTRWDAPIDITDDHILPHHRHHHNPTRPYNYNSLNSSYAAPSTTYPFYPPSASGIGSRFGPRMGSSFYPRGPPSYASNIPLSSYPGRRSQPFSNSNTNHFHSPAFSPENTHFPESPVHLTAPHKKAFSPTLKLNNSIAIQNRTTFILSTKINRVNINLGDEKKILTQLCIANTKVGLIHKSNTAGDGVDMKIGMSIGHLNMYDLSAAGEVHQKILWNLMSSESNAILIDYYSLSDSTLATLTEDGIAPLCNINIHTHGLRGNYIARYVEEVGILVSNKMIQPLNEVMKSVHHDIKHELNTPIRHPPNMMNHHQYPYKSHFKDTIDEQNSLHSVSDSHFSDNDDNDSLVSDDTGSSESSISPAPPIRNKNRNSNSPSKRINRDNINIPKPRSSLTKDNIISRQSHPNGAPPTSQVPSSDFKRHKVEIREMHTNSIGTGGGGGNLKHSGHGKTVTHESHYDKKEAIQTPIDWNKVNWCIDISDLTLYMPRNSCSTDLVAFTVTSALIESRNSKESWTMFEETVDCKPNGYIFYDHIRNQWTSDNVNHSYYSSSKVYQSPFDQTVRMKMSSSSSHAFSLHGLSRHSTALSSSTSLNEKDNTSATAAPSAPLKSKDTHFVLDENEAYVHFGTYQDRAKVKPPSKITVTDRLIITLNEIQIYTSLSGKLTNYEGSKNDDYQLELGLCPQEVRNHSFVYTRRKRRTDQRVIYKKQIWRQVSDDLINICITRDVKDQISHILISDTSEYSPLTLSVSMAELYLIETLWFDNMAEITQFFNPSTESPHPPNQARKKGPEVTKYLPKYGTPNYFEFLRSRIPSSYFAVVRAEVSIRCFVDNDYFVKPPNILSFIKNNMGILYDLPLRERKIYSSSHDYGCSQGNEEFDTSSTGPTISDTNLSNPTISHNNSHTTAGLPTKASYRDKSWHDTLLSADERGTKYKEYSVNKYNNIAFPAFEAHLSALVLYVTSDTEMSSMAVTAHGMDVWDIRKPQITLFPYNQALKVGGSKPKRKSVIGISQSHSSHQRHYHHHHGVRQKQHIRRYYVPNQDYGLNLDPTDVSISDGIPVQVSLLTSYISNWCTIHIGFNTPDLCLTNTNIIDMLLEYFGAYFQSPEYGNPVVYENVTLTRHYTDMKLELPYGGTDIRLFLTKPHLSVPEKPLEQESQVMFLETDSGIYYRYTADRRENINMEVYFEDMAMVLTKTRQPPSDSRGERGSAGSGRGIRTLVEYLTGTVGYRYHTEMTSMGPSKHIDLHININNLNANDETNNVNEAVHRGSIGKTAYRPKDDINNPSTAYQEKDNNNHTYGNNGSNNTYIHYIDITPNFIVMKSFTIPKPSCVFPLHESHINSLNMDTCDIVTSLEDFIFANHIIQTFLISDNTDVIHKKRMKAPKVRRPASTKITRMDKEIPYYEPAKDDMTLPNASSLSSPRILMRGGDNNYHNQHHTSTTTTHHTHHNDTKYQNTDSALNNNSNDVQPSMYAIIALQGFKFVLVDNLLGLHLPLLQAFIQSLHVTIERSVEVVTPSPIPSLSNPITKPELYHRLQSFKSTSVLTPRSEITTASSRKSIVSTSSTITKSLKIFASVDVGGDYFNSVKKCWEPLLERLVCTCFYEMSKARGIGIIVKLSSSLHINFSTAFIKCIEDVVKMYHSVQIYDPNSTVEKSTSNPNFEELSRTSSGYSATSSEDDEKSSNYSGQPTNQFNRVIQNSLFENSKRKVSLTRKQKRKLNIQRRGSFVPSEPLANTLPNTVMLDMDYKAEHLRFPPLEDHVRVGFSILNLTGQSIRYLQTLENGRKTVQYLNHNERGILNFLASTTIIRNNDIVEESFDVQQDHLQNENRRLRNKKRVIGHQVAIQVAGYNWLPNVQADELGVKYMDLYAVYGRLNALNLIPGTISTTTTTNTNNNNTTITEQQDIQQQQKDAAIRALKWQYENALKLVTEVIPNNGGRMLLLRSVFQVVNKTSHSFHLIARFSNEREHHMNITQELSSSLTTTTNYMNHEYKSKYTRRQVDNSNRSLGHSTGNHSTNSLNSMSPPKGEEEDVPFTILPGEAFNIPLALLHGSVTKPTQDSNRRVQVKSLGYLWIRPAELTPVKESIDTDFSNLIIEKIEYSERSIDLYSLVEESARLFQNAEVEFKPDGTLVVNTLNQAPNVGSHTLNRDNDQSLNQLCCFIQARTKRAKRGQQTMINNENNTLDISSPTTPTTHSRLNGNSKLPPFCYNIDVRRIQPDLSKLSSKKKSTQDRMRITKLGLQRLGRFVTSSAESHIGNEDSHPPLHYSIDIHPPLLLENLLPADGLFEIFHATTKRAIWKAKLAPGATVCIHTVTLDDPLLLKITLRYCKTVEGILINKAKLKKSNGNAVTEQINQYFEELFFDDLEKGDKYVDLVDTVGQRIRLGVENKEGDGGERYVTIYCPYWIVNTSQYAIRIREESSSVTPAGTVFPQKDGSRPVIDFSAHKKLMYHQATATLDMFNDTNSTSNYDSTLTSQLNSRGYYPGMPGLLHSGNAREIPADSSLGEFLGELSLQHLLSLAFMFNFQTDTVFLGPNRVCVQMDDSEWSASFSLDNLEINQTIAADHYSKGALELGFKVKAAPGKWGKYTKIVRFMPHVVVINNLNYNVKLLQPTGYAGKFREVGVPKGYLKPFHFPDANSERKLSIQVENTLELVSPRGMGLNTNISNKRLPMGSFHKSATFSVDFYGDQIIAVTSRLDLATIPHVNTRGFAEYSVILPAQEIGLYFETDWHEHNIVVKNFQKNSYASTQTDIQIGDVLVAVDEIPVSGPEFERAMSLLKERLKPGGPGCVIKLQTVEEKMRIIRDSANNPTIIADNNNSRVSRYSLVSPVPHSTLPMSPVRVHNIDTNMLRIDDDVPELFLESPYPDELLMRLEIRQCEASSLILLHHAEEKDNEYKLHNHSLHHTIIYKQRNIPGNRWRILGPGQSTNYYWDDPFKQHKLIVRVGTNLLCPRPRNDSQDFIALFTDITDNIVAPFTYLAGSQGDSNTVIINFDEIGRKGQLPIPESQLYLGVEITSEGPAKTLNIFHSGPTYMINREILYTRKMVTEQIKHIKNLIEKFSNVHQLLEDKKELSVELEYMKDITIKQIKKFQSKIIDNYNYETVNMSSNISNTVHMNANMMNGNTNSNAHHLSTLQSTTSFNNTHNINAINHSNSFNYNNNNHNHNSNNISLNPNNSSFHQSIASNIHNTNNTNTTTTTSHLRNIAKDVNLLSDIVKDPLSLRPEEYYAVVPYESILGDYDINNTHRLLVQVLEARDLKPFVSGKVEDVYCRVYLKIKSITERTSIYAKRYYTYMCEETLEPTWIGQKFLLDVPARAAEDTRGIAVRITVASKSVVNISKTFGKTDIHFSSLKSEEPVIGWFPLRPTSAAVRPNSQTFEIIGSVKLKLQWVHSHVKHVKYNIRAFKHRLKELEQVSEATDLLQKTYLKTNELPSFTSPLSNRSSSSAKRRPSTTQYLLSQIHMNNNHRLSLDLRGNQSLLPFQIASNSYKIKERPRSTPRGSSHNLLTDSRGKDCEDEKIDKARQSVVQFLSDRDISTRLDRVDTTTATATSTSHQLRALDIASPLSMSDRSLYYSAERHVMNQPLSNSSDSNSRSFESAAFRPSSPSRFSILKPASDDSEVIPYTYNTKNDTKKAESNTNSKNISYGKRNNLSILTSPSVPKKSDILAQMSSMSTTSYHTPTAQNKIENFSEKLSPHLSVGPITYSPRSTLQTRPKSMNIQDQYNRHMPYRKCIHREKLNKWTLTSCQFIKKGTKSGDIMRENLSSWMKRTPRITTDHRLFSDRFNEECIRNHVHVHTKNGTLEITPLQALHLPETLQPLFVKVSYGDMSHSTFSVPHATDILWYYDDSHHDAPMYTSTTAATMMNTRVFNDNVTTYSGGNNSNTMNLYDGGGTTAGGGGGGSSNNDLQRDYYHNRNESLKKIIPIDILNSKGSIQVKIMAEYVTKKVEMARIQIPIFNLLDCICTQNETDYDYIRWFPLFLSKESLLSEGEIELFERSYLTEQIEPFTYRPCIRLKCRWIPSADMTSTPTPESPNDIHDLPTSSTATTIDMKKNSSTNPNHRHHTHTHTHTHHTPHNLSPTSSTTLPSPQQQYFRLSVPSVSISVIDSDHAREIVQLCGSRIDLRNITTKEHTEILMYLDRFQIDNQLMDAVTPVLLHQTQTRHPQPILRLLLRKNNILSKQTKSNKLSCYDYFQLVIQEIDIHLEQQTVISAYETAQKTSHIWLNTFPSLFDSRETSALNRPTGGGNTTTAHTTTANNNNTNINNNTTTTNNNNNNISVDKNHYESKLFSTNNDDNKLYIDRFYLNPIKINISFLMTPGAVTQHRDRSQNKDSLLRYTGGGILFAFSSFLRQVGEVVLDLSSNISNAPILIGGMTMENLSMSNRELTNKLQVIYFQSIVSQIYKLVGSLDSIYLVSSLGVGVKTFFVEPAQAIINNPTDFEKIGLAAVKGTVVLVSKTTDGIIGTGTTITRNVGKVIAKLSMDDMFIHRREELQRQPSSAMDSIMRPLKDINNGIYCSFVGLARIPARNVRAHGLKGLVPGIAKGMAGFPTKIVVGALDAVTHTGDALRHAVKTLTKQDIPPVSRWRLSSLFGPDGRILPYNFNTALGVHTLHRLNASKIPIIGLDDEQDIETNNKNKRITRRQSSTAFTRKYMSAPFRISNTTAGRRRATARPSISHTVSERRVMTKTKSIMLPSRGSLFSRQPNDPLEEETEEIDSLNGAEFVVHTAIIRQEVGIDRLVIVSNIRILIIDYNRSVAGAFLVKRWESELSDVIGSDLDKTGGKASLTIKTINTKITETKQMSLNHNISTINNTRTTRMKKTNSLVNPNNASNSITIYVDYQLEDTLKILHNCINTLLHQQFNIQSLDKETPEFIADPDEDIFYIGPWIYDLSEATINEEDRDEINKKQNRLIEDLQMERWAILEDGSYNTTTIDHHQFINNNINENNHLNSNTTTTNSSSSHGIRGLSQGNILRISRKLNHHNNSHTSSLTSTITTQKVPKWLIEERIAAIKAHDYIALVAEECEHYMIHETHIDVTLLNQNYSPEKKSIQFKGSNSPPSSVLSKTISIRDKMRRLSKQIIHINPNDEEWRGQCAAILALKEGRCSYIEYKGIKESALVKEALEYGTTLSSYNSTTTTIGGGGGGGGGGNNGGAIYRSNSKQINSMLTQDSQEFHQSFNNRKTIKELVKKIMFTRTPIITEDIKESSSVNVIIPVPMPSQQQQLPNKTPSQHMGNNTSLPSLPNSPSNRLRISFPSTPLMGILNNRKRANSSPTYPIFPNIETNSPLPEINTNEINQDTIEPIGLPVTSNTTPTIQSTKDPKLRSRLLDAFRTDHHISDNLSDDSDSDKNNDDIEDNNNKANTIGNTDKPQDDEIIYQSQSIQSLDSPVSPVSPVSPLSPQSPLSTSSSTNDERISTDNQELLQVSSSSNVSTDTNSLLHQLKSIHMPEKSVPSYDESQLSSERSERNQGQSKTSLRIDTIDYVSSRSRLSQYVQESPISHVEKPKKVVHLRINTQTDTINTYRQGDEFGELGVTYENAYPIESAISRESVISHNDDDDDDEDDGYSSSSSGSDTIVKTSNI